MTYVFNSKISESRGATSGHDTDHDFLDFEPNTLDTFGGSEIKMTIFCIWMSLEYLCLQEQTVVNHTDGGFILYPLCILTLDK